MGIMGDLRPIEIANHSSRHSELLRVNPVSKAEKQYDKQSRQDYQGSKYNSKLKEDLPPEKKYSGSIIDIIV